MCEVEREWEHPATATGLRLAREQRARVAQPPSVLHPPPPPHPPTHPFPQHPPLPPGLPPTYSTPPPPPIFLPTSLPRSTCFPLTDLPLDDRLAFLRELRHAYGRTGLVLSGGGSLGFWWVHPVGALRGGLGGGPTCACRCGAPALHHAYAHVNPLVSAARSAGDGG